MLSWIRSSDIKMFVKHTVFYQLNDQACYPGYAYSDIKMCVKHTVFYQLNDQACYPGYAAQILKCLSNTLCFIN